MEAIKNLVDEIRKGGDSEELRKKLEENFSEFYNSKKDAVLSIPFDEKFLLRELRLSPELAELEQRAKAESCLRIVPLKMVRSPGLPRQNDLHQLSRSLSVQL